jgi:hypothetical protein
MTPICNETKDFNIDSSESISLSELTRKWIELERETPPSRKVPKTTGFGNHKSNKRGKLHYNLLRQGKSK